MSDQLLKAAQSLSVDALTATVTSALQDHGVPSVVLKGPAIAEWLYQGRGVRAYGDTDLLISPHDWDRATAILRELGFVDDLEPLAHPRMESATSYPWVRDQDHVDLHSTLWGIRADPAEVWQALSARTVPMMVGGREVRVLEPGPRALHVALHAAQHGPVAAKPLADLALAVSVLPLTTWTEAARVATELEATGAFAIGLRSTPAGVALAEQLGVAEGRSVEALIRAASIPLAEGFQELATSPGVRAKLALVRRETFPNSEFMRWWSPLARRGRIGLAAAYLWRPLWLLLRVGPGLRAWRRARKDCQGPLNGGFRRLGGEAARDPVTRMLGARANGSRRRWALRKRDGSSR